MVVAILPNLGIARVARGARARIRGILALGVALALSAGPASQGQEPGPGPEPQPEPDPNALRVEARLTGGVHYVGQGFELQVAVVARGQRPTVETPVIAGADVWLARNEIRPISVVSIGRTTTESNAFISRFRIVPRRAGTLEIPPVRASLAGQSGRGRPLKTTVRPLPPEGRPSEFLGGVGSFTLEAEATPHSVRVGQEFEYRLTISGPAAWGTTGRPELKRFDRLPLSLRIQPGRTDAMREPPSRTFVYRLRPTRPGEAVLPPVAVAAFDPSSQHYVTRMTPGVRVKVVAVPAFDPSAIPDLNPRPETAAARSARRRWILGAGAGILLVGSAGALAWARRRARQAGRLVGPSAARRHAAAFARELAHRPGTPTGSEFSALALAISLALVRYLELGIGRPPGALTPDEAGAGVRDCTGSDELGEVAARIAARCDGVLYRDVPAPTVDEDPEALRRDARELFERLGGAWSRGGTVGKG